MWQSFAAIGLGILKMWLPKKTSRAEHKPVRNGCSGRPNYFWQATRVHRASWPPVLAACDKYSVSQKIPPPLELVAVFPKRLGIFQPNFTCLLRVPIYARLRIFNYLQLWRSYAILSVTTQFISCLQSDHHRPKRMLAFSDILPEQLGISSPNFTRLLSVHTYARVQIFIQLSPTLTKLCHIKCDHPVCVSVDGGHFEHIMVVALNMA